MKSKALEANRLGYVNKVYVQFVMLVKATKSGRSKWLSEGHVNKVRAEFAMPSNATTTIIGSAKLFND